MRFKSRREPNAFVINRDPNLDLEIRRSADCASEGIDCVIVRRLTKVAKRVWNWK